MVSVSPANAWFGPKPGSECSTITEARKINGKKYICDLNRSSKLTWIPNWTPSNAEKATSLAFAGCVQGYLNNDSIYWYPRLYLGSIVSYGYATNQIKYSSTLDYAVWQADYISGSFVSASTLDKSWGKLSSLWEAGLNNSLKKWKSGGLDALDAISASKTYDVQITGICNVALSKLTSTAKKYSRTNAEYVAFSVSGILPSQYMK